MLYVNNGCCSKSADEVYQNELNGKSLSLLGSE